MVTQEAEWLDSVMYGDGGVGKMWKETLSNIVHDSPCAVCGEGRILLCFVRVQGTAVTTRLQTLCGCQHVLHEHVAIRKV